MTKWGQENNELKNFKFKWEKDKIIIEERFYKSPTVLYVRESFPDSFFVQTKNGNPEAVVFSPPNFYYSATTYLGIFSIVAECNKF